MKISEIYVDGFGVWHDRAWTGLSDGINVFHGPNEAGKTTLMSFIRSILFGFERRSHSKRYEPQKGGKHGGSLSVTVAAGEIRVERKAGRHVRGAVKVHHRDGTGDEQMLEGVLGGTTRTLYHNVFACVRGSDGYPKGLAHQPGEDGLMLRPAIPSAELFGVDAG